MQKSWTNLLDFSWHYLGRLRRTSARALCKRTSGRRQDMSFGVTYQTVCRRPHNICRRRPQEVSRRRLLALHVRQYGNVLRTLQWDVLVTSYFVVLRTSNKDVPWRYIHDQIGTSKGHLLGRGRPQDVIQRNVMC